MPSGTHFIRQTAQGNGIIVGSGDFGAVIAFDPRTDEVTVTQMPDQTVKKPFSHPVAFGKLSGEPTPPPLPPAPSRKPALDRETNVGR